MCANDMKRIAQDAEYLPKFVCIIIVCLMVFNATFNNISVIWWWSVLLVEEIGGPGENHRPAASH